MHDIDLDNLDRRLLGLAQREFPLTRSPYAELGRKLDISGGEVMRRLGKLKSDGLIRQIGPIVDSAKLGYQSTLAAMKLDGVKAGGGCRDAGRTPWNQPRLPAGPRIQYMVYTGRATGSRTL